MATETKIYGWTAHGSLLHQPKDHYQAKCGEWLDMRVPIPEEIFKSMAKCKKCFPPPKTPWPST